MSLDKSVDNVSSIFKDGFYVQSTSWTLGRVEMPIGGHGTGFLPRTHPFIVIGDTSGSDRQWINVTSLISRYWM